MTTRVVNIYKESYDVYIGRAGKGQEGYFGNPHPVGYCEICKKVHKQGEAVEAFRLDFNQRIKSDPGFQEKVLSLKGKRLGCFCKPKACHGDVFVEYLERETCDHKFVDSKKCIKCGWEPNR